MQERQLSRKKKYTRMIMYIVQNENSFFKVWVLFDSEIHKSIYTIYTMHRSLNIRTQHFSRWWCIFRVLLLNNQFRLTIRKQIEEAIRFCYVFTNHQMKWQAFPLQTSNSADCIVTWIWQYLALTSIDTSKVLMNLYLPRWHAI